MTLCSFQLAIWMRVIIYLEESIQIRVSLQQIPRSDSLESHQTCRLRRHVFLNHRSIRLDHEEESVETQLGSVFEQKQRGSCIVFVGKVVYPIWKK